MRSIRQFVMVAALLLSVSISQGVPTYVSDGLMTWSRGAAGSTYQDWTFDDADSSAVPESYFNSYIVGGDPLIAGPVVDLTGADGSVPFQWQNGVWMGDPLYAMITIPNDPVANPFKTIWFEMKYKAVDMFVPDVTVENGFTVDEIYSSDVATNDGWRLMTKSWLVRPNPSIEFITFALEGTGGFLDSVSVDTLCSTYIVPAPGAIALGAIGILFTGYVRRRMK